MSLYVPEVSYLSVGPRFYVRGNYFFARTGRFKRLLSLYAYERRLLIDKDAEMIRLSVKRWWIKNTVIELPFSRVRGVVYQYKDHGTSWSVGLFWMGRTDSIEIYTVSLALMDPKENLPLFKFLGEGSVSTGYRGVFLGGDDFFDLRGSQTKDSLHFVDTLCKFLGVRIVAAPNSWE